MIKREVPYISYQDFLLKVLEMAEFLTYHRKKILVVFVISALLMTGLCGQLGFLMIARSDHYSKMADALHERERTIKAARGEIVDRNGTVIAANRTVCTVSVIHNQVKDPEKVIRELARILDLSEEEVRKKVEKWSSREIIRTNVEKSVGDEIMNLGLSGVKVDEDYRRYYPYGSLASKVLGFTGADNQGIIGLEVMYEKYLKGQDGLILTLSDAKGTELQNAAEERVEPIPGNTLTVSLDVNIQKYAEQAAYQVMEKKGAKAVSIIIMNPQNGEIYAMVNAPEFDLNDPFSLSGESSGLTGAELQDARNKMWRNRCINDTYEPGSTFKIITAAAGLEAGVVHLDDKFSCPGFRIVEDRKIRCHKVGGHGAETFLQGAMNSCNPVFIDVGQRLGVDSFYHYFEQFGLLGKTGIDLPGEAYGLIYNSDNMGPTDLAVNSFGQSYNCTMIQMAAAFASVINGGSYYEPHVVKQIVNDQGSVVRKIEPNLVRETVSESTSEFIRHALFMTVDDEEGTGKAGRVAGYKVGGKTGTAEKLPRSAHNYLVSFCGFAPADDPQLLVYVVIDTPNLPGKEQAHSTFATEVFQKIMTEALPYLNVFPDTDTAAEDASLADQSEGITNNNEGGLEPGTGETEAETEAPTDADGNVIPQETTPQDEVVPFDDGLGLPDDMPADTSDGSDAGTAEAQSMEAVQETETVQDGTEETMETTQAAQ